MIKAWRYREDGRDSGSLLSEKGKGGFGMEGVAENKAGYFALRAQHSVDDMKGVIIGGGSLAYTRGGAWGPGFITKGRRGEAGKPPFHGEKPTVHGWSEEEGDAEGEGGEVDGGGGLQYFHGGVADVDAEECVVG